MTTQSGEPVEHDLDLERLSAYLTDNAELKLLKPPDFPPGASHQQVTSC